MKHWELQAVDGTPLGMFEGETVAEALDKLAEKWRVEKGYDSVVAMAEAEGEMCVRVRGPLTLN